MPQQRLSLASKTLVFSYALLGWFVFSNVVEANSLRRTAVVRAVERARPSVVNIHGRKAAVASPAESGRHVNGMGTGIVIDERGYVMTNYHVVQGVAEIRVTLHNGSTVKGRLIAHDPKTDLAVVKISASAELPTINVGTSKDLMPGETVIAVGNAYGYNHTVTKGIISALHRTVQVSDDQKYYDLIQTDASINPGNSGGPLLNIDGEMIGINVAVRVGAQGIGFAIPVNEALAVAARLLSVERVGNLTHGIEGSRSAAGIIVRTVDLGTPAAVSGLRAGDIITQIDGKTVKSQLDLERYLIGHRAGDEVPLTVNRKSEQISLSLVLRKLRTGTNLIARRLWNSLGLRVTTIAPQVFKQLGTRYHGGLKVDDVRQGSTSSAQGIRTGDILVGVHKWETVSMDNMSFILSSEEFVKIQPVKFYILRDGETLYGYLTADLNRLR